MLKTLFISNYALIERIEIDFESGLNVITGETGSGKSIVLDALSLIMGERADTRTIRQKDRKTVVEATFDVSTFEEFKTFFENFDIDFETDNDSSICIMRREISAKGTSRAFINDTPVNLTKMKEVAVRLLDIHSQHANEMLTRPDFQLHLLDILACNDRLLEDYRKEYKSYRNILKDYTQLRERIARSKAEAEFNRYQLEALEKLDVKQGEQEQLEKERDIVANATQIKSHLLTAIDRLSDNDSNALSMIGTAAANIETLSEFVEDSQNLCDRLNAARVEIEDIVDTLREYDNTIATTETDLQTIELRLGEIYAMQSRHNVKSDNELIEIRQRLRRSLDDAENGDETLRQLEQEAKSAKKRVVLIARNLSERRQKAATEFTALLKDRAIPLGMSNLRCDIRVSTVKLNENGMDSVEFLFAFNRNQALMPIGDTASGGEISRIALAVKSLMVEKMQLPTIIFDEIDAGVSGDVANRMGRLMLDISRHTQVITITHIPTVAAHGKRHFKVFKEDDDTSTFTLIKKLDDEERLNELACMISGNPNDAVAIETAENLIQNATR